MRVPDWIVYSLALTVVLWALLSGGDEAMAPEAPLPEFPSADSRPLPPPSAFDERILIQVEKPISGTGTAFALNRKGQWVTARHVVDGCNDVALEVAPGTLVPVADITLSGDSDLALLTTGRAPQGLPLKLSEELNIGTEGFHVGYPQGRPGEATSTLLARSKLITRGDRQSEEEVLSWAEKGRTRGLLGSLAGISGGPVFDAEGNVLGVTIAESPRRGRIYTTSPAVFAKFLEDEQIIPDANVKREDFTVDDYGSSADSVRRSLAVVKVVCHVDD